MKRNIISVLALLALLSSCTFRNNSTDAVPESAVDGQMSHNDSLARLLDANKQYLSDSLLKTDLGIIDHYFARYQPDTCVALVYTNAKLRSGFSGTKVITGLSKGKEADTVFVMPPFNYCDDGDAYCFFDKTLPRLLTDSYCCHPDNLFVCADIDEDGIREIGIFHSSCVSRYKSLLIYSLKNGEWKEIGASAFDIYTQDPGKVQFESLIKKVAKGKFKLCGFLEGATEWETITME